MSNRSGIILGAGQLPATGESWRLRLGTVDDLEPSYDLQAHVLGSLSPQDRYYIVPKTRAHMAEYLEGIDEAALCVLEIDGQQAGQLIVRPRATAHERARHAQAFTACGNRQLGEYLLVQGALIDPAWRGRHLLRLMLQALAKNAFLLGGEALLARIVPPNMPSWISFLEAGFIIAAAARDPDDERQVFYLYKEPHPAPLTGDRTETAPEFKACQTLLSDGWHGTSYDRTAHHIIFSR